MTDFEVKKYKDCDVKRDQLYLLMVEGLSEPEFCFVRNEYGLKTCSIRLAEAGLIEHLSLVISTICGSNRRELDENGYILACGEELEKIQQALSIFRREYPECFL